MTDDEILALARRMLGWDGTRFMPNPDRVIAFARHVGNAHRAAADAEIHRLQVKFEKAIFLLDRARHEILALQEEMVELYAREFVPDFLKREIEKSQPSIVARDIATFIHEENIE